MCSSFCLVAPPRGPRGLPRASPVPAFQLRKLGGGCLPESAVVGRNLSVWPQRRLGVWSGFWVALCPTKPGTESRLGTNGRFWHSEHGFPSSVEAWTYTLRQRQAVRGSAEEAGHCGHQLLNEWAEVKEILCF